MLLVRVLVTYLKLCYTDKKETCIMENVWKPAQRNKLIHSTYLVGRLNPSSSFKPDLWVDNDVHCYMHLGKNCGIRLNSSLPSTHLSQNLWKL